MLIDSRGSVDKQRRALQWLAVVGCHSSCYAKSGGLELFAKRDCRALDPPQANHGDLGYRGQRDRVEQRFAANPDPCRVDLAEQFSYPGQLRIAFAVASELCPELGDGFPSPRYSTDEQLHPGA